MWGSRLDLAHHAAGGPTCSPGSASCGLLMPICQPKGPAPTEIIAFSASANAQSIDPSIVTSTLGRIERASTSRPDLDPVLLKYGGLGDDVLGDQVSLRHSRSPAWSPGQKPITDRQVTECDEWMTKSIRTQGQGRAGGRLIWRNRQWKPYPTSNIDWTICFSR